MSMSTSSPEGPSITWSMPVAVRSSERSVEWTSTALRSCIALYSPTSGFGTAAARGSSPPAGSGSFATSSDCSTTRAVPRIGSTS